MSFTLDTSDVVAGDLAANKLLSDRDSVKESFTEMICSDDEVALLDLSCVPIRPPSHILPLNHRS